MDLQGNLSNSKRDEMHGPGASPSTSLMEFLEEEIIKLEEFRNSLRTQYDNTTYDEFERRFNDLRNVFKRKSMDISDSDQEFLNHAESRRIAVEQIFNCATKVAQRFQEARENNRLDRPQCTSALEDLVYAIMNLKNLSLIAKEQGKIS
jgi:hypothetical protein